MVLIVLFNKNLYHLIHMDTVLTIVYKESSLKPRGYKQQFVIYLNYVGWLGDFPLVSPGFTLACIWRRTGY